MSDVDVSNAAAVRAEAERRQALRDAGRRLAAPMIAPSTTGAFVAIDVTPRAVAAPDDPFRGMNNTERRRAIELEAMRRAGEVGAWFFEAMTFKLADDLRYTPDFLVITPSGRMTFEETKGHWRDDARAKIKMAAARFPFFAFVALRARRKKDGGGWAREAF